MTKYGDVEISGSAYAAPEDAQKNIYHDDGSWEPEDINQHQPKQPNSPSLGPILSVSATLHRTITMGSRKISTSRKSSPTRKAPPPLAPQSTGQDQREVPPHTEERGDIRPHLRTIRDCFIKIIVDALKLHQPLFSLAFAILIAYAVFASISSITESVALPLCHVPILNKAVPLCSVNSKQEVQPTRWEKLANIQSSSFGQLLDKAVGESVLALEIKKAEMTTSNLVTLVQVSDFQSRDILERTLVNFVDEAKKTGRGLQSLSSKVNDAVDTILAVNEYAMSTIEAASTPVPMLYRVFSAFLRPLPLSQPTKAAIEETFLMAMDSLSKSLERLIIEAEASRTNLVRLEQSLSLLHDIFLREDVSIQLSKSAVLLELWAKLLGNNRELQEVDEHLVLLKDVCGYRKRVFAYVEATLQTLGAMRANMEELRSSVAAPDIVGDKVPVEVHMRSIMVGLERLKEGQMRAKEREDETMRGVLRLGVE